MNLSAAYANISSLSVRQLWDGTLPVLEISGKELPDPEKTFDCGQCFRFEKIADSKHESEWGGVAHGRYVSFAVDGGKLYVYNSTEEEFNKIWFDFLDLGTDYGLVKQDILSRSDSEALKKAVNFGSGIRILRQDPWETLCSFIISQNNNIPRIKKLVTTLSERSGTPIDTNNMLSHGSNGIDYAFPAAPSVEALGIDELAGLRTGFRAKYIYDAAKRVSDGSLDVEKVLSLPTAEASELLCTVKGVGPKVAACTLLFGFGKHDAFPIDVWIKRAVEKYFGSGFDPSHLGAYAGVAQQYLFYYERYLGGE